MSEGAQAPPLHLEGVISTKRKRMERSPTLSSRLSEAHGEIPGDLSTTLEMTKRALEMTDGALEMTK